MTIVTMIQAVQDAVLTLSNVRVAPDYAPDNLNVFPAVVCYPRSGTIDIAPTGVMKALHNLVVEVHVARRDLVKDLQSVIPFGDSIPEKLLEDPTLNGTISTFGEITYEFGPLAWGETPTIGYRFVLNNCKMETAIST